MNSNNEHDTPKPPRERPEPPPIVDVKESDEYKPRPNLDKK